MCCFPLVQKEVKVKKGKRKYSLNQRNSLRNIFWCSADSLSQRSNFIFSHTLPSSHHDHEAAGAQCARSWGPCAAHQNDLWMDPDLLLPTPETCART